MRKHFILYWYFVYGCLSLAAFPAEKNLSSFKELQEIADREFPLSIYRESEDNQNHAEKIRLYYLHLEPQGQSLLFTLPAEILVHHIFPCLNNQTFCANLTKVCKALNDLATLSFFYLNDYCLHETRPASIPHSLLTFKIRNTCQGILKLGELWSVTQNDLAEWFDWKMLRSAFLQANQNNTYITHKVDYSENDGEIYINFLPQTVKELNDQEIDKLYPLLKIGLALIEAADKNIDLQSFHSKILELVNEYNILYQLPVNKLRLLTLIPDKIQNYDDISYEIILSKLVTEPAQVSPIILAGREVIARRLLMKGKKAYLVNNLFFAKNIYKKDEAQRIFKWCIENIELVNNYQTLFQHAFCLGYPEIAIRIVDYLTGLPNNVYTLPSKIYIFNHFNNKKIKNNNIELYINEFCENFYILHWPFNLDKYSKIEAIQLMINKNRREDVSNMVDDFLLLSPQDIITAFNSKLISKLAENKYYQIIQKLTTHFLSIEKDTLLSDLEYLSSVLFMYCIKNNREKTVGLLKNLIDGNHNNNELKISALSIFVQHAIIDEQEYIRSYLNSINLVQNFIDTGVNICKIYYYLGNHELCQYYYLQSVKILLNAEDKDTYSSQKLLKKLRNLGLKIDCFKDLENIDSFEIYSNLAHLFLEKYFFINK